MAKRDQDVHFLASKEEVERIHEKMDELGIRSMGAYLRKMALDGYCIRLDLQDQHITGRQQKNNIIAYQIRQSFKPGEITPEEANQVGYETAMRWTKGKHAFIVATHIDKSHIHNHIIYNSTSLDP